LELFAKIFDMVISSLSHLSLVVTQQPILCFMKLEMKYSRLDEKLKVRTIFL
jgi:hypothetical protein